MNCIRSTFCPLGGYLSIHPAYLSTRMSRRGESVGKPMPRPRAGVIQSAAMPTLVVLALLVGCGGGGGDGASGTPPPTPTPPPDPAPTAKQFVDITDLTGISFPVAFSTTQDDTPGDPFDVPFLAGGVAAGDYDNDGLVDLFVSRGDIGPNLLYRNVGDNRFEELAGAAGLATTNADGMYPRLSGPTFADMDGDGDLDLFAGGVLGDASRLYLNNGDGTFSDVTQGSGLDVLGARQTLSAAFGDYDLDGDLDLLLAHWGTPRSTDAPGDTEHLWRNVSTSSQLRFESVSVEAGLSPSIINLPDPRAVPADTDHTFAPSFARINEDLYPDIVIAADFNTSMVFVNNGDGTFDNRTDVAVITETNGMGSALGDYDQDGDLDWFVTSIFRASGGAIPNGNRLYRNDNGQFADVTETVGVADGSWGWAACFADLDNDGRLDLYHTNGWPFDMNEAFDVDTSRAFMADGRGGFLDRAASLGLDDSTQGRGVVCADFDNDGDIDIFLWSSEAENGGRLFRNDHSGNNFVTVRLNGLPPNTYAAGARVHITVGGETQMRELTVGSNFVSQNPLDAVFGIGQAAQVDALRVEWPDGQRTDLGVVSANQRVLIEHPAL